MQRKELTAYAELVLGATEYKIFEDAGYSAKNTDRPAYQEMMAEVRNGYYSHILVWKIDLISRNLLDFSMMYSEINRLGVTFVSKNEQFDTSTAIGEAMLKIILVFAELERNMTSERVASVMVSRAADGIWNGGRIPFGYTYNKDLKSFFTDPDEAKVVDLIYYYYEHTASLVKTSQELNQRGYRTRNGSEWNPVTIRIILRSPFYIGIYRYNYHNGSYGNSLKNESEWVVVRDHHPAIISENRYQRVNKMLDANAERRNTNKMTKNRGNVHIFQGLLQCGHCGSTMTCTSKTFADGLKSSSYLCPTKRRDANAECRHTSDIVVGSFVLNFIVNLLDAKRNLSEIQSTAALNKALLRGPAFNGVSRIDQASLDDLFDVLHNALKHKLDLKPRISGKKSDLSKAKNDVERYNRAIERLRTLFLYDDAGMSKQEYIDEKKRLDSLLADAVKRFNSLSAMSYTDKAMSDTDFVKKASAFAFQRKMQGGKFLNYRKLVSSIDTHVIRDFTHSIIDHIVMKYGRVSSITFLNGVTAKFIYFGTNLSAK